MGTDIACRAAREVASVHLFIANKCYSSWSLRPWLVLRAFDLPFTETIIPLDLPDTAARIGEISGAGRVPVLIDGETKVWESLAIIEYLAETYPELAIWPRDTSARAHARAAAAEMHAGFTGLRSACPMNLAKRYRRRDRGYEVAGDVARIEEVWREARQKFGQSAGGSFLYGAFCAADAMYAPVITRLDTYDIAVQSDTREYMDAVLAHPSFVTWRRAGLQEDWVVPSDEIDEEPLEDLRPHLS